MVEQLTNHVDSPVGFEMAPTIVDGTGLEWNQFDCPDHGKCYKAWIEANEE